jgi:flagellar hook assembly protein FlgD
LPSKHILWQNHPNPFNARTTIQYRLSSSGHVCLRVYNLSGQAVKTLVDEEQAAGDYLIEWNARSLSSGMYMYILSAGDYSEMRKMVLLK